VHDAEAVEDKPPPKDPNQSEAYSSAKSQLKSRLLGKFPVDSHDSKRKTEAAYLFLLLTIVIILFKMVQDRHDRERERKFMQDKIDVLSDKINTMLDSQLELWDGKKEDLLQGTQAETRERIDDFVTQLVSANNVDVSDKVFRPINARRTGDTTKGMRIF